MTSGARVRLRITLALFLLCLVVPAHSSAQSGADDELAACPPRAGFYFISPYTSQTYAGYALRGSADSFLRRVYYLFSAVPSQGGTGWRASGTFWLYGWECRIGTITGLLAPGLERLEFAESQSLACSGSGGGGWDGGTETGLMPVTNEIQDPSYDPYDAGSGDCESGEPGGEGGGGDGSDGQGTGGTQYQPGDNTGGETVDWGTGIGNGGTSACGTRDIVDYVCIDVWVDGAGWVEWACGYVTTC